MKTKLVALLGQTVAERLRRWACNTPSDEVFLFGASGLHIVSEPPLENPASHYHTVVVAVNSPRLRLASGDCDSSTLGDNDRVYVQDEYLLDLPKDGGKALWLPGTVLGPQTAAGEVRVRLDTKLSVLVGEERKATRLSIRVWEPRPTGGAGRFMFPLDLHVLIEAASQKGADVLKQFGVTFGSSREGSNGEFTRTDFGNECKVQPLWHECAPGRLRVQVSLRHLYAELGETTLRIGSNSNRLIGKNAWIRLKPCRLGMGDTGYMDWVFDIISNDDGICLQTQRAGFKFGNDVQMPEIAESSHRLLSVPLVKGSLNGLLHKHLCKLLPSEIVGELFAFGNKTVKRVYAHKLVRRPRSPAAAGVKMCEVRECACGGEGDGEETLWRKGDPVEVRVKRKRVLQWVAGKVHHVEDTVLRIRLDQPRCVLPWTEVRNLLSGVAKVAGEAETGETKGGRGDEAEGNAAAEDGDGGGGGKGRSNSDRGGRTADMDGDEKVILGTQRFLKWSDLSKRWIPINMSLVRTRGGVRGMREVRGEGKRGGDGALPLFELRWTTEDAIEDDFPVHVKCTIRSTSVREVRFPVHEVKSRTVSEEGSTGSGVGIIWDVFSSTPTKKRWFKSSNNARTKMTFKMAGTRRGGDNGDRHEDKRDTVDKGDKGDGGVARWTADRALAMATMSAMAESPPGSTVGEVGEWARQLETWQATLLSCAAQKSAALH